MLKGNFICTQQVQKANVISLLVGLQLSKVLILLLFFALSISLSSDMSI
jgi:hypothetical protein